jgi:hypothetical protein
VHFGLGGAARVDELEVRWSSGALTLLEGVQVNQTLTIVAPAPADLNGDGQVNVQDLTAVILAWGRQGGAADVNGDGPVDVLDLIAVFLAWT